MIPLADARAHVLAHCRPADPCLVPIAEALDLVTAERVVAPEPVPPFDNTAMDGFAVRATDTAGATTEAPVRLQVVATLAAGASRDEPLAPGEAVRIMTGAPMPPGADAVVMVERTVALGPDEVGVGHAATPGDHVRRVGDDVAAGDEVLPAGTRLRPAHLGVLASVGRAEVRVVPRLQVGVLSTGDELVGDGAPLRRGQIRESNRPMLLALVDEAGAEPVDLGLIRDDEGAVADAIRSGARTCDALVTSGGVSVGDFDVVKAVLDRLADMAWMQIAIRPAKPFAFGLVDGTPVFGLPGNPVSSLVSFELLARPALRRMMGRADVDRPLVEATAPDGLARQADGKVHYVRVAVQRAGAGFTVRSVGAQGSHQLVASAGATGLAVLADGDGVVPGGTAPVLLLDPAGVLGDDGDPPR